MTALTKVNRLIQEQYQDIQDKVTAEAIEDARRTLPEINDINKRQKALNEIGLRALHNFQMHMQEVINQYAPNSQEWLFANMYFNSAETYCKLPSRLLKTVNDSLSTR